MSKIKKTSSKKNTGNSHNDFNSFRIEQLEPRLLMSATAAPSLLAERGNPFRG